MSEKYNPWIFRRTRPEKSGIYETKAQGEQVAELFYNQEDDKWYDKEGGKPIEQTIHFWRKQAE